MGTPGHIETDPLQEAKGKIKRINPRELMTLLSWQIGNTKLEFLEIMANLH